MNLPRYMDGHLSIGLKDHGANTAMFRAKVFVPGESDDSISEQASLAEMSNLF